MQVTQVAFVLHFCCHSDPRGLWQATFWLSHLAGAKAFVDEQVQSAVTRGKAFAEGASRLQTAAFGQIASNLEAFGIRSLKEFRSVCTLASSHCARLRQLLRPSAGSMRTPAGIFDGKVLVITGAERQSKLEQSARQYFRNIVTRCVNTDDHEVYVGAVASSIASEISQTGPGSTVTEIPGMRLRVWMQHMFQSM
eukprot:g30511.t1